MKIYCKKCRNEGKESPLEVVGFFPSLVLAECSRCQRRVLIEFHEIGE